MKSKEKSKSETEGSCPCDQKKAGEAVKAPKKMKCGGPLKGKK